MPCKALWQAIIFVAAMSVAPALAAPKCPIDHGAHAATKPSKLYLFFPEADLPQNAPPSVFPFHGFDPESKWRPLLKFDSSQLRAYVGTDAQLREAVHDVVTDIFCEFNVQVITTTTLPPETAPRRNIVGIGSDMNPARPCHDPEHPDRGPLFGEANTAGGDPGDSKHVDFGRVWARSFGCPAFTDTDLQGAGWANAIGSTAAHEAAHNYGLSHEDGEEKAGGDLDGPEHHLMQGDFYKPQHRTKPRHFSNFETSVLARLVGLSIDTMWTWEFVNPNTESAVKVRMELLSEDSNLILSWAFTGDTSPWINPVLSGPSGVRTFEGKEYKVYHVEWAAAHGQWSGGPPGQVPQGKSFQVGATFSAADREGPDPIIIIDVKLFSASGQALPQQPPWMAFDAGKFDIDTGNLNVTFFNVLGRPLFLRDVQVRDLPRMMSINAMMRNKPISDVFGRRFLPWDKWGIRQALIQSDIKPRDELKVPVANRGHGRHISVQRNDATCKRPGRGIHCHTGITADDLFPATTMYITATVVDPAGAESQLFYQVAGRRTRMP